MYALYCISGNFCFTFQNSNLDVVRAFKDDGFISTVPVVLDDFFCQLGTPSVMINREAILIRPDIG